MLIGSHKPTHILYDFITDDDDVGGMVGMCVITAELIPGQSGQIYGDGTISVTIRQLLTLPHWAEPLKYVESGFVYVNSANN